MSENCKCCGKPMIILNWNSRADALVCDNSSCRFFRQPISVPKGSVPTLAEELGGVYSRHRNRPRERKHVARTFEEKLQELRENISA